MTPYSRRPSDTATGAPVTVLVDGADVEGAGFVTVADGVAAAVGVGVRVSTGTLDPAAALETAGPADEAAVGALLAGALPGVALPNAAGGGVFVGAVLKLSRTMSPATVAMKTATNLRTSPPSYDSIGLKLERFGVHVATWYADTSKGRIGGVHHAGRAAEVHVVLADAGHDGGQSASSKGI
jgi:hypothetical protein